MNCFQKFSEDPKYDREWVADNMIIIIMFIKLGSLMLVPKKIVQ